MTSTPTVDKLARQHFHLARPLAPIPQILRRDRRVRQELLVDILRVVIAFRPEHAIILRLAFAGRAPSEERASLPRERGRWFSQRLTGRMAKKLPKQLGEDGRVHDAGAKNRDSVDLLP